MLSPKHFHKLSLNRLECYLKQTKYHGLVLNLNYYVFKVDTYPDAAFSGMYGHDNPTATACVNSCAGFIITFEDFPFFVGFNVTDLDFFLNFGSRNNINGSLLQGIVSHYRHCNFTW